MVLDKKGMAMYIVVWDRTACVIVFVALGAGSVEFTALNHQMKVTVLTPIGGNLPSFASIDVQEAGSSVIVMTALHDRHIHYQGNPHYWIACFKRRHQAQDFVATLTCQEGAQFPVGPE